MRVSKVLRSTTNGYLFWCPGCDGAHHVNTVDGITPRWGFNGNVDMPTFTPSVLVKWNTPKGFTNQNPAPLGWQGEREEHVCHSFVTDGHIQFLGDCTHTLRSQTVDLPDFDQWGEE